MRGSKFAERTRTPRHRRLLLAALAALTLAGCKDQCKTACDCPSGYACLSGTCASGTAAVFCCDKCPATAPPGQICQHHDGSMSSCGKAKLSGKP